MQIEKWDWVPLVMRWSGWRDSNPRPSAPKADALIQLRYIPTLDVVKELSERLNRDDGI